MRAYLGAADVDRASAHLPTLQVAVLGSAAEDAKGARMTPSVRIYRAAGSPPYPGTDLGACRLCGADGIGLPWEAWVKDTFTDHDKLHPGAIICHACQHATDDDNIGLTRMAGRCWSTAADVYTANPARLEKWRKSQRVAPDAIPDDPVLIGVARAADGRGWWVPQRMRNYSHLVTPDGWRAYMKNEKAALATALLDVHPPCVAVISIAGQKHLIPRARVGWWQIEEHTIRPDREGVLALLGPITALYSLGATKGQIEHGTYNPVWLRTINLAQWGALEARIRPARGALRFMLALWLAQREETPDDDRDTRPRDGAPVADLAGTPPGLQEPVPDHDLAHLRGQRPQRRLHDHAQSVSQPDLFAAEREPPR